eukprot:Platyproteum_vivax@DN6103_c0_g1_i3.p1
MEILGVGFFSVVYRAFPRRIEGVSECAIKVIRSSAGQEAQQLLRREFDVLRKLGHPAFVTPLCIYQRSDSSTAIVMELVKGRTLQADLAVRKGPYPEHTCKLLFRQLIEGLEHLHRLNIVHRDLTAANVMISPDCSVCKILDLNVCKLDYSSEAIFTPTAGDEVFSRSPEQAGWELNRTECEIGPKIDIFTAGCLLFRMLTNRDPFGDCKESRLSAVLLQDPSFTEEESAQISEEAKEVVFSCLHKEVPHRWTARQVLESIWLTDPEHNSH